MLKFFKLLGVLAIVGASTTQASAFSSSIFPVNLTGTPEEITLTYTSGEAPFSLSNLSLVLGPPGSPGTNILLGVSGALTPYTGAGAFITNLAGSLSEIISGAPAGNYTFSYTTGATGSINVSVSPVPLPASAPLFALAMLALGFVAYRGTRARKQNSSDFTFLSAA